MNTIGKSKGRGFHQELTGLPIESKGRRLELQEVICKLVCGFEVLWLCDIA